MISHWWICFQETENTSTYCIELMTTADLPSLQALLFGWFPLHHLGMLSPCYLNRALCRLGADLLSFTAKCRSARPNITPLFLRQSGPVRPRGEMYDWLFWRINPALSLHRLSGAFGLWVIILLWLVRGYGEKIFFKIYFGQTARSAPWVFIAVVTSDWFC